MTGSKNLTPATLAAAQAPTFHPVILVKMEFDEGDVNLHTEIGDIVFNGDTYTGVGTLGQVGAISEVSDLSQSPINLTLSGLPIISILLQEQYQGRLATIYLGYLNLTTYALIDAPTILYKGLIDTADFQQDKQLAISLSVGNRFAAWNTPILRRYNNANQQVRFPGDNGLRFIEKTTNKTVIWGAAS